MLSIFTNLKGNGGTLAGGNISIAPLTAGIIKAITKSKNTGFTIPQGAYVVEIFNNDIEKNITVNGAILGPQLRNTYSYKTNSVSKLEDYVQELIIVNPDAVEVIFSVEYPSNSLVNVNTI